MRLRGLKTETSSSSVHCSHLFKDNLSKPRSALFFLFSPYLPPLLLYWLSYTWPQTCPSLSLPKNTPFEALCLLLDNNAITHLPFFCPRASNPHSPVGPLVLPFAGRAVRSPTVPPQLPLTPQLPAVPSPSSSTETLLGVALSDKIQCKPHR